MLLEALWEKYNLNIILKNKIYSSIIKVLQFSLIGYISLAIISFTSWLIYLQLNIVSFCLFNFFPIPVNAILSSFIYVEILGCLVCFVFRHKMKYVKKGQSFKILKIWTLICTVLAVLAIIIWRLTLIDWAAVWIFLIINLCLFSSFPELVNFFLSLIIYTEIIGCVISLISIIRQKYHKLKQGLKVFCVWTKVCFVLSMIVFFVWSLFLINWPALWAFIVSYLCIFTFFPALINFFLSLAVYIEITGCIICLIIKIKQKYSGWEQSLNVLKNWSIVGSGLAVLTFLIWFFYSISDYLAKIIAMILLAVCLVIVIILLKRIIKEIPPRFIGPLERIMYSVETWRQNLEEFDSHKQAILLRRTSAETLSLSVYDFLILLHEVESNIKKDPALSAYWAKRFQIEQIIKQEKLG